MASKAIRAFIGITAAVLVAFPSLGLAQQPAAGQPQQPTAPPPAGRGGQPPATGAGPMRRPTPPQPQQKQSADYFAGTWQFTWTGRESPVTPGPRAGTLTATRTSGSGNRVELRTEGKIEDGPAFTETATLDFDEAKKTVTLKERASNGTEIAGTGDWASPLSIKYESQPTKAGNQTVRLRRTYAILSATSFTVAEEISIDGGPFQRLGLGSFTKQ